MSSFRQSFSWWCFANRGTEPADLLKLARGIGYEGVELIDEELWPAARDNGLQIVTAMAHASIASGMNDRAEATRIEKEVRASIAKAGQWKIPVLICFAGTRRDGESGIDATSEILGRLGPVAGSAGVTLALELLNSKVDHIGYECDRTSWGMEVIRRANSPAVKLLYDIYHMQVMEGDVIRTIENNHAQFAHYHTAGNPGRGEPDETQELNYPAIYRAIAKTGYQGWIGHEFLPRNDLRTALTRAFKTCRDA